MYNKLIKRYNVTANQTSTKRPYPSVVIVDLNAFPFGRNNPCTDSNIKFSSRYWFDPNVISLKQRQRYYFVIRFNK